MSWEGGSFQNGPATQEGSGSDDDGQKPSHRDTEKRRRQLITENVTALRNLVPGSERRSRSSVLIDTVSYIQKLQAENNQLRSALAQAEKNITALFNTNTRLIGQVRAVQEDNARLRGLAASFLPDEANGRDSARPHTPSSGRGSESPDAGPTSPGGTERKRKRWTTDEPFQHSSPTDPPGGVPLLHAPAPAACVFGTAEDGQEDVKPRLDARPPLGGYSASAPDVSSQGSRQFPAFPNSGGLPHFPGTLEGQLPGHSAFLQHNSSIQRRQSMPAPVNSHAQGWVAWDDGSTSPRKRQRTGAYSASGNPSQSNRLSAPSMALGGVRRHSTGDVSGERAFEPLPVIPEPVDAELFSVLSPSFDDDHHQGLDFMRMPMAPPPFGVSPATPPASLQMSGFGHSPTSQLELAPFAEGDGGWGDGMRHSGVSLGRGDPSMGVNLSVPGVGVVGHPHSDGD